MTTALTAMLRGIIMVWNTKPILLVSLLGLLAGCAMPLHNQAAREALLPEIDVEMVRENAEKAMKQSMTANLDLEALTVKVAGLDNSVTALSEDIANVSPAKIEELETRLTLITEALKNQQEQIWKLEKMIREGVPAAKATGATAADTSSIARDAADEKSPFRAIMPSGSKGSGTGAMATFSPASASGLIFSPEYEAFQDGLRLFSSRKYQLAIKAFNDVLEQFPDGKFADNVNYWIGESYYSLEEFPVGISFFEKVKNFKGSSKADDAQFKTGMSYLKMGQQALAKDVFKDFLEQYPGSEYTARIGRYLKQLK